MKAHLQHGKAGEPMRTEAVEVRRSENTSTRYAKSGPIASHWQAKYAGKWRRIMIGSCTPATFIIVNGERIAISTEHKE